MEQTVVSIRMDKSQKEQFETVAEMMGITTSALMNIFISRVIAEKRLPFPLEVPNNPWYRKEMKAFWKMKEKNKGLAKKYGITSDKQIVQEIKKIRRGEPC